MESQMDHEPENPGEFSRDHRSDDLERMHALLGDIDPRSSPSDAAEALDPPAPGRQLERLYAAAKQISATLDLELLAQRTLDTAIDHVGAERGALFLFDSATATPRLWASRGLEAEALEHAEFFSSTILEEARARRPVITSNAQLDRRFRSARSVHLHEIRSVICVPVETPEEVIGALYVDRLPSGRRFPEDATHFLGILAGLAGAAVNNARLFGRVSLRAQRLDRELSQLSSFSGIVGRSSAMEQLLKQVRQVAATDFPVLLRGESGSGKELVARALHATGARRTGAFIAQNCAAIPVELLESEFFGHVRGAFTGAREHREGLFRLADGGTLLLDEVAELHPTLQAKLLRVLEDGMVRPVGAAREEFVDFRLISASSTRLETAVEAGRFRRDLYYRLNVIEIEIPPLRRRPDDIPLLIDHFLRLHAPQAGGREMRFAPDALEALALREWRGNVRELAHLVKRALVMIDGPVVHAQDLELLLPGTLAANAAALPLGRMTLPEIESAMVTEALRRTGGNKLRAAQLLGIHRNSFLRRLRRIQESTPSSSKESSDEDQNS
jgi:transcriptional regulator with GAF, ATPase, and Fis domain